MKKMMRKLFGTPPQAGAGKNASTSGRDNPLTIEDGSDNATHRQLVQMLLRDMLQRHGIPLHWVECQVLLAARRSRGPGMYVRLVVKHWDDRLMTYAFAFQNTLLADIARFEPQASDWLHGISWQLEVAGTCPHLSLPDKSFWLEPVEQASPVASATPVTPVTQSAQPAKESDARQDLERLFVERDQEIGKQAADGNAPVGYEKTWPAPL